MKIVTTLILALITLLSFSVLANDPVSKQESDQPTESLDQPGPESNLADQYIVAYLHMNRRCATCEKLEAYSSEAVSTGFVEQLKDSSLIWQVVNFEEPGNEHLAKDYGLYTQSVILSKLENGLQTEWKALDQIWVLVGDKEKFIAYVQSEVKAFMQPEKVKLETEKTEK